MTRPELDLGALEQAAERAGLPGLEARMVPPDPRRSRWFTRKGSTLLVNERVLERLSPPEGQALLTNTVLSWKHMEHHRRKVVTISSAMIFMVFAAARGSSGLLPVAAVVFALLLLALIFVGWSRALFAADDESVELLGEAEVLVRAFNVMSQDRLDIGKKRVEARPDLHRRAERLVTKHQLRLPPEQRSVLVESATLRD
jgi:hypothetical protein